MAAKLDYWSKREVSRLARLRNEGMEIEDIARELLRTPCAVRAKLTSLGLTEVKGDGVRWSTEEDNRLMTYRKKNYSVEWIAQQLRRTPMAILGRLEKLRSPTRLAFDRSRQKSVRECLCCRQIFRSSGPGNRLCQNCRSQSLTRFDMPAQVMR